MKDIAWAIDFVEIVKVWKKVIANLEKIYDSKTRSTSHNLSENTAIQNLSPNTNTRYLRNESI